MQHLLWNIISAIVWVAFIGTKFVYYDDKEFDEDDGFFISDLPQFLFVTVFCRKLFIKPKTWKSREWRRKLAYLKKTKMIVSEIRFSISWITNQVNDIQSVVTKPLQ